MFREILFKQKDASILCIFRIIWGCVLWYEANKYSVSQYALTRQHYYSSSFLFTYDGFPMIERVEFETMMVLMDVFRYCSYFIVLGVFYRVAMPVATVIFTYIYLLDQTQYLNHHYLIILISFVMMLAPANCRFSLDAYIWPDLFYNKRVSNYWYIALRSQLALIYVFAAAVKLNEDWLRGEPMRHWMINERTKNYTLLWKLTNHWSGPYLFSFGGLVFDMFIIPMLCMRSWVHWIGMVCYFSFHLINKLTMGIGVFPYMCMGLYILFMNRYPFNAVLEKYKSIPFRSEQYKLKHIIIGLCLVLWFTWQIVLPMRWIPNTSPEQHAWNDYDHYFAWRMKLRNKDCRGDVFVKMHRNDTKWELFDPIKSGHLTSEQHMIMTETPKMCKQYAEWLADKMMEFPRIKERPQITMNISCSLNYRKPQFVFFDGIDLANKSLDISNPDNWIVPLNALDAKYREQYLWDFWPRFNAWNGTYYDELHKKWVKVEHVDMHKEL
jgi:vitamin K-dependent gamma-carboxylase